MNLAINKPMTMNKPGQSQTQRRRFTSSPSHVNTECLPHSVQVLIRLLGTKATMRVLQRFGGRSIYIPKKIKESSSLLAELTLSELEQMVQYYGGETIDLPQAGSLERHWRNLDIAAASAAGASRADLVAKYGLSQRQIGNIRRRYRSLINYLGTAVSITSGSRAY